MKRRPFNAKIIIATLVLLMIALLTESCQVSQEKTRKPSEDWSRGLPLASDASSTIGFEVDKNGERIYVVIPHQNQSQENEFRYLQLNSSAEIILEKDLEIELRGFARSPRLELSEDRGFHLFWLTREDSSEGWHLWYGLFHNQGEQNGQVYQITSDESGVGKYDVVSDGDGGVIVVWQDTQTNGIFMAHISSTGETIATPHLVVQDGEWPSVRVDDQVKIHLIWMEDTVLMYHAFQPGDITPFFGESIARLQIGSGNTLKGLSLGLSDGWISAFWSVLKQAGLEAGTAKTEYVVFPVGKPDEGQIQSLNIMDDDNPFNPYRGSFALSQLMPPPQADFLSTNYILSPVTSDNQNSELIVSVSANQTLRLNNNIQIVLGVFNDGEYQGYTVATKTETLSKDPVIKVDDAGNLYLVWREGASGSQVFLSTTSSEARTALDGVSSSDLPSLLLTGGLEAITGILLFPFALPWMVVGFVLLIVWRLIKNDEDLTFPTSKILLIIAIISYQVLKVLFLSPMLVYVPFSAWVDIPAHLELIYRVGVPLVIFTGALLAAQWFTRKSTPAALTYYLVVVIVDCIFTLAIYGVILLGEY